MSTVTNPAVMARADLDALLGFGLSDEQWDCVSAPLEPFVIVAGAGTGKTTVMAARVLWLVASGLVADHEVLGLTFTNKAAAELAHRISTLLARWREVVPADPVRVGEPTVATYHSFARRLIDEQGLRVGIEPGARLLGGAAVAQLAHREVCRAEGLVAVTGEPARVAQAVLRLDANLAEQTISTDELRAHDRAAIAEIDVTVARPTKRVQAIRGAALQRIELAGLVDDLRAAKQRAGGLGFEDHMRLCVDLVRAGSEIVDTMRRTFRVILLDEYQDTSIAQRVILSTLFGGCAVTAVGDPMQAIYGWRSASVANIESFGAHFGRGGRAEVRVLGLNRRSGSQILGAANRIAAALRVHHPQIATLRPPEPREATVRAALLETVAEERLWVADQVAALISDGRDPAEIGVLVRANDDIPGLRQALGDRGVATTVSGTAALTDSPFAVAVLATLRLLADPTDNASAVALLAGPRWRIGPQDLARLGRQARRRAGSPTPAPEGLAGELAAAVSRVDPVRQPSLLEAAAEPGTDVSPSARARLAAFWAELAMLHQHVGEPLADLTALVVRVTGAGVEADLASGGGAPDPGLSGLLALVDQFADADGRTGLGAFVAHLDAGERFGAAEEVDLPVVPGAVPLMTMHKAKGLEWPVVVLPHLCRRVFPGGRASERWTTISHVVPVELRDDRHVLPALGGWSARDLDAFEDACRAHDRTGDDRLAYVAVTRARDVLVASGHWWGPTQSQPRGPSDYLVALREAATTAGDPWCEAPGAGDHATNPLLDSLVEVAWPIPAGRRLAERSLAAAAVTQRLGVGVPPVPALEAASPAAPATPDQATVDRWDAGMRALLAAPEGAGGPGGRVVRVPDVLSASAAMGLVADPQRFAMDLVRPMPRRRNRHADLGTAFHAWVEARLGVQPLLTDEDLPGAADADVQSPADLADLREAFEALPYARQVPVGLEVPFALAVGGRVIRGRMDAVFPAEPDAADGAVWEVVDWKTSASDEADPLQLAIYRLAWAQAVGVDPAQVRASFAFVRSGHIVRPEALPDADALAEILATAPQRAGSPPDDEPAPGDEMGPPDPQALDEVGPPDPQVLDEPDREAAHLPADAASPASRPEGPRGARRAGRDRATPARPGEQGTLW